MDGRLGHLGRCLGGLPAKSTETSPGTAPPHNHVPKCGLTGVNAGTAAGTVSTEDPVPLWQVWSWVQC